MNRDDKRRMKRIIQNYDRSLRTAHCDLEKEIELMRYKESEKLATLPSSFESSPTADNLTESAEMLSSILKKDEKIIAILDEILYDTGVDSNFTAVTCKTKITSGKKDVSFHALLPSSLLKRLKEESKRTGISMNEIACQALLKELKE